MRTFLLQRARSHVVLIAALALANASILYVPLDGPKLIAGLAMLFVLPGLGWLVAFNWFGTRDGIERAVSLAGISLAIASVALLGAVYWPGPLDLTSVLIALSAASLAGIAFDVSRHVGMREVDPDDANVTPGSALHFNRGWNWPDGRTLLVLAAILAVATFLRWYTLGYGEFHEDELENMRLAVQAMKGEEYAPFIDSKGPVHWLVPGALWLMHGWVNEAIARAPVAICGTLIVLATFMFGRRIAGAAVGLVAGAFVAINGLQVAYSRHVENSSLIILWAVLAAWCGYRYYEIRGRPGRAGNWLMIVGWLLLGVGLIAHPDMMLYVPPFVLAIGYTVWQQRSVVHHTWRGILAGIGIFLTLTAVFYIPFVRDPTFQNTVEYLAEERIGTSLLYNQVADVLEQETDYSSHFYTPWLVLFAAIAMLGALWRARGLWRALAVVASAGILTTLVWPRLWLWGDFNGALIPYVLLVGAIATSAAIAVEAKTPVLWFGTSFIALTFLARDASTHLMNVHPFWCLLAGIGLTAFWKRIGGNRGGALRLATVTVLGFCLGAILFYEHLQYLGTVAAYWRAEANARYSDVSLYRAVYGPLPRPRKLFSNPRLGGWKVVGVLYDQGELQGDFRTIKESFTVPIWYTHQTPRSCFEDPQNYFVAMGARGLPEEFADLSTYGYALTRVVMVDDESRLFLLEQGRPDSAAPATYDLDDYIALYDLSATPARYTQEPPVQHPLEVTFGQKLRLRGYDIPSTHAQAGRTVALTLHWQAIDTMAVRYRVFVHIESDRMWGQHDDDPVCRLRTDEWRPPQSGVGQFRIQLDPATPPGEYPVTVGIYNPDTGERLEAVDGHGQSLGGAIVLTNITVE